MEQGVRPQRCGWCGQWCRGAVCGYHADVEEAWRLHQQGGNLLAALYARLRTPAPVGAASGRR